MAACAQCGGPIPPTAGRGRPRTKCLTCSPRRGAKARHLAAVEPIQPPAKPEPVEYDTVADAVAAELAAAGARWTSAGMAAMVLAARIDESGAEPAAGLAALTRQLHQTIGEAVAAVDSGAEADDLDRLLASDA